MDHIKIPAEYVALAEQWHGGQDCILYAIASSGDLLRGTVRPWDEDTEQYTTDDEWYLRLYEALEARLFRLLHTKGGAELKDFYEWTAKTVRQLEFEMGWGCKPDEIGKKHSLKISQIAEEHDSFGSLLGWSFVSPNVELIFEERILTYSYGWKQESIRPFYSIND